MTKSRVSFSAKLRMATLATVVAAMSLIGPSFNTLQGIPAAEAASNKVTLKSKAGATPFVATVTLKGVNTKKLKSITFTVKTKPGFTSKPVIGKYSRTFLKTQGFIKSNTRVNFSVYGLYQNYNNRVTIKYTIGKKTYIKKIRIKTAAFEDSLFSHPTAVVPRNKNLSLDYSFMALKNWHRSEAPIVLDVDGQIRWIGSHPETTFALGAFSSGFDKGRFLIGNGTKLYSLDLNSKLKLLADYSTIGVTNFHHNIDKGKFGYLIEVDTTVGGPEATVLEVDIAGNVLKTFDIAQIVEDYLIAHSESPTDFVRRTADWFHSNAATYWAAENTLIVSGREQFVIGIDYDTKEIKWILGDTTKEWFDYPSLAAKALTLPDNDQAPIGQHSVSITPQNELMLFDNGLGSLNGITGSSPGATRDYSSVKRFVIDEDAMTAHMIWKYDHNRSVLSPITSSIYQTGSSYLINYSSETDTPGVWGKTLRLQGMTALEQTAFEYTYPGQPNAMTMAWNAEIVPLEYQVFR